MAENRFAKYATQAPQAPGQNRFAKYVKKPSPETVAPSAAPAKPSATTKNDALLFGLADTLAMGFADEGGSALGSVIEKIGGDKRPMGEIYTDILERGRKRQAASAEEHPMDYTIGQGLGILPTLPVGVGKAVAGKGLSLLERVLQGAKVGGSQGALYGFGSGENGLADRAIEAGKGAALGATVGAALPLVAKALGAPVKAVRTMFEGKGNFAGRKVAQAAERAGTTLPKAMQEVQRLQKTNPDTRLVDVLGTPGMRLARAVHTKGGEGAEKVTKALTDKQLEQGPRVTKAITKSLGDPNNFHQALDESLVALRTNAKPHYERAYESNINYVEHGPAITAAWQKVPERLRQKVVDAANDLLVADGQKAKKIGDVIGRGKDGRMTPQPSVQQWDYIKRGIDAVIEGTEGQAASGGMSNLGRALVGVKKELLETIDNAVPAYKEARKIYSDDLTVKNALEDGRKALNLDPEMISKKLKSLDSAAADMFRIGYARAVNDAASKVTGAGDVIARVWASPARRQRLQAVFGNEKKFAQFADLAEREAASSRLYKNVTGGSQTANKISDLEDAGSDFIIDTATQGPKQAIFNALRRNLQTMTGFTEKRASEVADLLLSKRVTQGTVKAGNRYQLSVQQKTLVNRILNGVNRASLAVSQQPEAK